MSRRGFFAWSAAIAGSAGTLLGLQGCGGGRGANGRLGAQANREVRGHAQVFRSRPDLRPPEILINLRDPSASPGLILTDCHAGPGQQGPLAIDSAGRLVWFEPLSAGASTSGRALNVRVQSYGGRPVLTWWQGVVANAHGKGHYEIRDTRYERVARVHAGNGYQGDLHDFLLTDSGTALLTTYGEAVGRLPASGGLGPRRGKYFYGVVQEVDVASGAVLFQWRSDDHVRFAESYVRPPADPSLPWDYFHVNSIAIDPSDGHLLISGRNTWAVYKVHRPTGAVISTLGGKRSDYRIGPRAHFAFQHHVTPHPGGFMSIFDNEAGPPSESSQSRGLVLRLNEAAHTAWFVKEYLHHPPVLSPALGSLQELGERGSAGAFVGWGDSSYFTRYDRSGAALLDGRLAPGTLSYRAFMQDWSGQPRAAPAIAVARSEPNTHVYASWNGATEHRQWRVLGGPTSDGLEALGAAPVLDFETVITIVHPPTWLAVEALDRTGRPRGRSRPVRA